MPSYIAPDKERMLLNSKNVTNFSIEVAPPKFTAPNDDVGLPKSTVLSAEKRLLLLKNKNIG